MRIPSLLLAIVVSAPLLILIPASAQDGKDPLGTPATQKSTDKVKTLQQERLATLKTLAEVQAALLRIGKTSPEAVLEARVLLGEAELDAAEKESDRVAALKGLVEVLKELEETAKARKVAAEASEAPVLTVKARRLEAEIRLERAQAKAQGQAANAEPKRQKVVVAAVQAKDIAVTKNFIGQIRSWRHIDVRSLENGHLEEVHIKEGQAVKRGDVMFKIAPALYQAKLDAELAEVEVAALNLKTTEKLFEKKFVSADEVALVKAKLAGAQAKATAARAELEFAVVRAPFDGIVGRLQQTQGSLVTEADILTTLSDNSVMWVYFNVANADYLEYMAGPAKDQAVDAQLVLAGGRVFPQPGKIGAIEAQFNAETGSIAFRADFPNPEGLLRHGMTGNVLIHRPLTNAIVIPQRATFDSLDKRYVYVVDKENVAHQREIVVQSEQGDDFVIRKGLEANDRIVLEGARQILDGDKLEYELRKP